MLEITPVDGSRFYLPLSVVRIITRNDADDLMLCYEAPNGQITWRKIKSASQVSGSKKIS